MTRTAGLALVTIPTAVVGLLIVAWFLPSISTDSKTNEIVIDIGDRQAIVLGQAFYAAECAACHGIDLEGQANWRVRLPNGRLPAPPHDLSGHTWHHPDAQLFAMTKYGVAALAGGDYQSDMPAYEDRLSDNEILAVLAYIKSTWPAEIRARHDQINESYRQQLSARGEGPVR